VAHLFYEARPKMTEVPAKLRSDLEIRPESNSGIIVKDPITQRFYRFTPEQASVLELLDGRLDLTSIAEKVSWKHRTEVKQEQLEEFIAKLRALLLLDHSYCWEKLENAARSRKTIIKSLLYIKIHAFDPDPLLSRLEKKLQFCFTRAFGILGCSAMVVAGIVAITNWKTLFISLPTLFTLYSIPFILIVTFTLVTIHEFAHGLTLKHFGGRVCEMGLLFLYGIPAFYCNVSDAWMLKKRERIWVSLAGSYIQVFIMALAIMAWRILAMETLASRVCLIIIAFTAIQTVVNFIPLIRLDGYYLLSDLIEIPNLHKKALAYAKSRFKSLLTGMPSERKGELGSREKRIFFIYGTSSFVFIGILIFLMFRHLGGWLVREYQTWGLIIASILFFMAVPVAKKENIAASKSLFRITIRCNKKIPGRLLIIGVLIAAGFLPWELKISSDFAIAAFKRVSVTPQVVGNLKRIYVDHGSRVHAGQILAEIENLELDNEYQETKGELESQKAALDLLYAGSRPEEIEKAKRFVETKRAELQNVSRIDEERAVLLETVAKKDAELANAKLNYERTQSLLKSGLIARNEADRYRTAYEVQLKELSEAKGQLNILEEQTARSRDIKAKELAQAESELKILLAGSREESIRAVESQVKKLEEKLNILDREVELLKIKSPIDGVVATSHLTDRIGDYLDKGDEFCEIVGEGTVIIDMPIPEKEIGDIRLGFPITLKVRGYPRRWYEAHVKSIAPIATDNGSERSVLVQGELENSDGSLRAGMTGVGKILCGKRIIFDLVSRRAIRWLRTEFWEYLP
jgi:putative peptide zinc metalloprotease protein